MKQLSIYSRQKHHSNKDVTISIGQDERVHITFRNSCWTHITKDEYIRIYANNGKLVFDDSASKKGKKYKLFVSTKTPTTRYVDFKKNALPECYAVIERKLGAHDCYNFNLDEIRPPVEKETTPTADTATKTPTPATEATPHVNITVKDGANEPCTVDLLACPVEVRRFLLKSLSRAQHIDLLMSLIERIGGNT